MSNNDNEIIAPTSASKRPTSRFYWGQAGILVLGVAVGIFVGMMILVNYGFLGINSHFAAALTDLTNRFNQSSDSIALSEKTALHAEQTTQETSEIVKTQSQLIADIQKTQKTNKNDFLMLEAFHLVKMANDSLQYESNIPAAIKLVQSADANIAKLTDPDAFPVREALAADLVALQSAPQVDVAGVYLRLAALSEQIDKIPLISQLLNKKPDAALTTDDQSLTWWRRGLNSMEQALQRIVIVRKNLPNTPPFITPDQQVFLYQNLHAELEKAQWGLLQIGRAHV